METIGNILLVCLLVGCFVWNHRHQRNGRWHQHASLKRGLVMRRRAPDGTWQYRELTDDEEMDRQGYQP